METGRCQRHTPGAERSKASHTKPCRTWAVCGVGTAPYGGQRIVPLIWGHMDMGCDLSPLTSGKWATDQYNLIKKSWLREEDKPPCGSTRSCGGRSPLPSLVTGREPRYHTMEEENGHPACPGPSTCMSWQPCLYMETHKQTNKTPKTKPKSINQSAHLRLTGGSTGRLSWGTAAWKFQGCLGRCRQEPPHHGLFYIPCEPHWMGRPHGNLPGVVN